MALLTRMCESFFNMIARHRHGIGMTVIDAANQVIDTHKPCPVRLKTIVFRVPSKGT